MLTCPSNVVPITSYFYIVSVGVYRGMHYFLFVCFLKLCVLVRTASMKKKILSIFPSENCVSIDNQADVIKAFNSTSRYLDDLLNIDNPYFEGMVNQIYPSELQLNKTNTSDTEAPFLDFHLSISNGFVSSKIYDKRDDFDFDIVNVPFLDCDVPRRPSYGVYISQLIRFAR